MCTPRLHHQAKPCRLEVKNESQEEGHRLVGAMPTRVYGCPSLLSSPCASCLLRRPIAAGESCLTPRLSREQKRLAFASRNQRLVGQQWTVHSGRLFRVCLRVMAELVLD